jgi:DNA polymerase III subunit beta
MQISVIQENLAKALNNVIKAIDARPPLPVLANVLLEAEGSHLRIVGSNLQMSISIFIGAKVDRPGRITLPAKTFTDLVGRLAKERVDLRLDELTNTIHVRCGATEGSIKGIAATEYPPVKQSDEQGITMRASVLKEMILHTVFACAREDNRPILTGIYTEVNVDALTMAAADGYRLAVRTARLDDALPQKKMVIPAKTMLEVARLLEDTKDDICITFPNKDRIVTFRLPNNIEISAQLLDGIFPDFTGIIPKARKTQAVAPVQDWLKRCQIAEIFARDDAHSGRVIVKPSAMPGMGGEIIIAGRSAERGHSDNRFEGMIEGDTFDAHFDIRYLIEMFNTIAQDQIVFEANGNDSPAVWKIQGREDAVFVVMPMTR